MKLSFRNVILCLCASIIGIITLILFVLPFRMYTTLYRSQAESYTQNIILQTNLGIIQSLLQFEDKLSNVIDDIRIRSMLTESDISTETQHSFQNIIEEYFDFNSLDNYYLEGLEIYPMNGEPGMYYGYKTYTQTAAGLEKYREAALVYPNRLNWLPYNQDMHCLEATRCIYDHRTYELRGLLIIRLSDDFLSDKFQNLNILDVDSMYILDLDDRIVFTSGSHKAGTFFEDAARFTQRAGRYSKNGRIYTYAKLQSAVYYLPYSNWTTVISLDSRSMLSGFTDIRTFFIVLAVIILIFSIYCVYRFSKALSAPILALTGAMKEAEKENFGLHLPENMWLREYKDINHGFNRMTRTLDVQINTIYKAQLAQKEAQLKLLRSQINPHFLFNTLQLISWKAYEYEATPVCEMLSGLSFMLQTDLETEDESSFTLRQEKEYIRQYTLIISSKYDNKIRIYTQIPDELLDCIIPKLVIQPFIENAVIHGLAPKTSPGSVWVSVKREKDDLVCRIEDDGIGMNQELLHRIQESNVDLSPELAAMEKGHQIALANVQRRLKLLYGDEYGFGIESGLMRGTCVTLRIPCRIGVAEC